MRGLKVAVLSDGTGQTAELMLKAALSQFPDLQASFVQFRGVRSADGVTRALSEAEESGVELLVTTMVDAALRDQLSRGAEQAGIRVQHLLGPLLEEVTELTGCAPCGEVGAQRKVDERYFKRVKALEYTITCDDGKSPQLWKDADLVLYGVSRAGKTPLSMFLADRGVAVANVPLLPDIDPDPRAYEVDPAKRVGLIISSGRLREIRLQRLKLMGLDPEKAYYAKEEHIAAELAQARALMERLGCRIYESTDQPVEVLGLQILYDFGLI